MTIKTAPEPVRKNTLPLRSRAGAWLLAAAGLLAMLILNTITGPVHIPLDAVIQGLTTWLGLAPMSTPYPDTFATILLDIRLPNAVLVALTGMALGSSGAAYQGVFRNPLADPYIIGVASGAGLGAVAAMSVHWPGDLSAMRIIPLAAFAGAMLTVMVVYGLARVGKTAPISTLILAGVAVSAFTSALTSLLMLISTAQLHRAIAWLLGGFALGGWEPVRAELPYLILGIGALVLLRRPLNVLQFGDEQALQLGLHVERYKAAVLIAASLTAAAAVSFSGVIGFVGLIVPHAVRLIWGSDYRHLLPLSTICGGMVLLAADSAARMLLAPQVLPVGIITAMIGAPFFLLLLKKTRQERLW